MHRDDADAHLQAVDAALRETLRREHEASAARTAALADLLNGEPTRAWPPPPRRPRLQLVEPVTAIESGPGERKQPNRPLPMLPDAPPWPEDTEPPHSRRLAERMGRGALFVLAAVAAGLAAAIVWLGTRGVS